MDKPENYYAILGVPINADSDMLKRAYRGLARRYHPDLAGEGSALDMKRVNRAYAVLSDPEKRRQYDTVIGGVIDLRRAGTGSAGVRVRPRREDALDEDLDVAGLSIFSTKGPWRVGPAIASGLGVVSALGSVQTVQGLLVAAGSLDGKGMLWQVVNGTDGTVATMGTGVGFASDPTATVESLRELRFSEAGRLIGGWGRLHLHVWDAVSGQLLWSQSLLERAVSAHYSLDMALLVDRNGRREVRMALPHLAEGVLTPRYWGFRATDVGSHELPGNGEQKGNKVGKSEKQGKEEGLSDLALCVEEGMENRQFWSIRLRALSSDARRLTTLSCAHVAHESQEVAVLRCWDLSRRARRGGQVQPQLASSLVVGRCADCTPPYVSTPDGRVLVFVHAGKKLRVCDIGSGSYSELVSGTMGSSSKLALSSDGEWIAAAREDSEINEGVVDIWSVSSGQLVQKMYHPWQISALHFAGKQLLVALTDGTIQIWQHP